MALTLVVAINFLVQTVWEKICTTKWGRNFVSLVTFVHFHNNNIIERRRWRRRAEISIYKYEYY